MIGASSGAKCEYDEAKGEWRISFWRGWGDCPAGCIYKEDTARYVVDRRGRVFEADGDFNPVREVSRDDVINSGGSSKKVPLKKEPKQGAAGKSAPDRKTVWIGRSTVIGQCTEPELFRGKALQTTEVGPEILAVSGSPGVTPGPRFSKWIEDWEKERFEADRESFMCEACRVCYDFAREFMLIYKDDLKKFQAMDEWMRVDK